MADRGLTSILQKSRSNDEELIDLTQSIMISESIEDDFNPKPQNQFQTAKQLSIKNSYQKSNTSSTTSTSNNCYNPALQARKLLGSKRRFNEPKGNNESGYRDEGRDINTEFR